MATREQIANMALQSVGVTQSVANLNTDKSLEAMVCRTWYDISRDYAIEDFDWNFARRHLPLAQILIDPPSYWAYAYAYPNDCAAARAIEIEGMRTPFAEARIPYEVAAVSNAAGDYKVIYTNRSAAVLIYTKKIADAGLFDAHFTKALSWLLAANIAIPLSVKADLAKQAANNYQAMRTNSFAFHMNESQEDVESPSETERARNG